MAVSQGVFSICIALTVSAGLVNAHCSHEGARGAVLRQRCCSTPLRRTIPACRLVDMHYYAFSRVSSFSLAMSARPAACSGAYAHALHQHHMQLVALAPRPQLPRSASQRIVPPAEHGRWLPPVHGGRVQPGPQPGRWHAPLLGPF